MADLGYNTPILKHVEASILPPSLSSPHSHHALCLHAIAGVPSSAHLHVSAPLYGLLDLSYYLGP